MFDLIKKFFSNQKKPIPLTSKNQELIEKIQELAYNDGLIDIINQPQNKLLILNVYYDTFEDLLFNIINKVDERQIASVNLHSYFKSTEDIVYCLKRIIPILQDNDVNLKIKHDIEELLDSIDFLLDLEY